MRVMIGVPAGRGMMSTETASTLMNLGLIFQQRQIEYTFACASHAEVTTARNLLAALFYDSSYDTFIGIDDDIGVKIETLEQLLDLDLDFLAAYQPQRTINLQLFEHAIHAGKSGKDAQFAAAPFVGSQSNSNNPSYGTVGKVEFIGAGFYILKRRVLEKMIERDLALKMITNMPGFQQRTYGFFNTITDDKLGVLSEDYSFCERVRRAGFDIHAYLGPGISHTGTMTFES